MADRDVALDECLLTHIFASNQPSSVSVILRNWDKCTLQVGSAANEQGREFQFSMMELVEGITLEEVWDHMTGENRASVATAVAEAISKMYSVRLSDAKVQSILRRALGERSEEVLEKAVLGGPSTGFLNDGPSLLSATIHPIPEPKGLVIQSEFEDLGSTTVSDSDMEHWPKEAVFCHNDLTPRNLMLQPTGSAGGITSYKLAAIIDWELAGFYPPSYQLSLQDTYLSGGNRHLSFYLLLKERLKDITPPSPSHLRRFGEMLGLSRDEDPYVGWKCEAGAASPPEFSREDAQRLEDDVVAEMIRRRQAKAKPGELHNL
ncbi:hypothetical protein C8A01DRAFT_45794 [Parachaetomium inaequale]|uniref:Aminoglycoside phosphotransferase domain-containing protein n=1 Tax=Parachaetomium inaequale TaxID=2588326 RepID=A0AAN6PHB2_9PEZI|nr:hypothetical protein C8A01DRAFT_45794 [Parachaetomium inaequale]